jgi:hypothetical protein
MSSLLDSIARRRRASANRRLGPPASAQLPPFDYRAAQIKGYAERQPATPKPTDYVSEPNSGEVRPVPLYEAVAEEFEETTALQPQHWDEPEAAEEETYEEPEVVPEEPPEEPEVLPEEPDAVPEEPDAVPEEPEVLPEEPPAEPEATTEEPGPQPQPQQPHVQPPLPRPLTAVRVPTYTSWLPTPGAVEVRPLVPRPRDDTGEGPAPQKGRRRRHPEPANTSVRVLPQRDVVPPPAPEPEPAAKADAVTQFVPAAVPVPHRPLPKVLDRTQLRRRARYLRQLRELQIRDLGGFALELHRFGQDRPDLIAAKMQTAAETDHELRGIEMELDGHSALSELRLPGIGGACTNCGSVYGSADRFCATCGQALGQAS